MSDPFLEMLAAEDPYPTLHALRASDPVHFVEPLGFWASLCPSSVGRLKKAAREALAPTTRATYAAAA